MPMKHMYWCFMFIKHKCARPSCTCISDFCLFVTSAHAYQAYLLVIYVYEAQARASFIHVYVSGVHSVFNHNYNKIVKSDWLSTALISALIGQFNRTVRVMPK